MGCKSWLRVGNTPFPFRITSKANADKIRDFGLFHSRDKMQGVLSGNPVFELQN